MWCLVGGRLATLSVAAHTVASDAPLLRLALAGSTALLITLSLPAFSVTAAIFVALVPMLVAIATVSAGRAFLLGWVTGIGVYLGAGSWVLGAIARFQHAGTIAALAFFLIFVVYHGLQLALFAAGVAWSASIRTVRSRSRLSAPLSILLFTASWWVVVEWAFPRVFPWYFSIPLAESPLLRQAADFAGIYGLSFVLVLVNAALARALLDQDQDFLRRMRPIALACGLVSALALYGTLRFGGALNPRYNANGSESLPRGAGARPARHGRGEGSLAVLAIQGGLTSGMDDVAAANEEAWATYTQLTTGHSYPHSEPGTNSEPGLIVWPETVLRVYLHQDADYQHRLAEFVGEINRPLFVGALDIYPGNEQELNSGYLIKPRSSVPFPVYYKKYLLPFAEYIPGASFLPVLGRWQTTGRFVSGKRMAPLVMPLVSTVVQTEATVPSAVPLFERLGAPTIPIAKFAPSICIEGMVPGGYNQDVRDGAEFLVNITDDGWFGDTSAPYQHLAAARLRAVETRRWLVRASNSGISAFIDPAGEVVASLPFGSVGTLQHDVERRQGQSFYVRFGDWPVAVCFFHVVVVVIRVFSKLAARSSWSPLLFTDGNR